MRVCHVTNVHHSDDSRIFLKECLSLAEFGFDTWLVASGESRIDNGVHVVGVGQRAKSRIERMTKLNARIFKRAVEIDADIYHLHDPELLLYALKLKKMGKKVIFDSHELYEAQILNKPYIPKILRRGLAFVYTVYQKKVFRKIDAVIFPCLQHGMHPFDKMCKMVETVDNYPKLEELYDKYDSTVEKKARSLCYIGSISENRGITQMMVAAFRAKCVFYLAGSFNDEKYREKLEKKEEYKCVKYLGQLNRDEVNKTIQSCQIGLSTVLSVGQYNQFDNLPTKAYEYMSLGVPVILTAAEYNNEIVSKYKCGICVNPMNEIEYSDNLDRLLNNPKLMNEMGVNARIAIKETFNWNSEKKKLIQLYLRIGGMGK